jgi:hypothetical protein
VKTVRFLTRQGCPVCDEAYQVVAPLAAKRGIAVDVHDVDLDLRLLGRYDHRVPVLLDPTTGNVLAEGHIGRRDAIRALRRLS